MALVAERRNSIAFRVNTLGLCDSTVVDKLLSFDKLAIGDADQRRETRIATVSVFLPANNPADYDRIMQP